MLKLELGRLTIIEVPFGDLRDVEMMATGVDPGPVKGRGTSCRWLGRALVAVYTF